MTFFNRLIFLKQILTPAKIYNLALKELQYFLGSAYVFSMPNKINIDIGNICNLKCPLCPTGRGDTSASRGFMHYEDYKKVIDELGRYLTKLELYNWGEPLLHRDLIRMIRYAKARNIPVCISTNLNQLSPKMAEDLISTRIDKIFVSCDGASAETYLEYRVGGDFDRVVSNIRLLVAWKKRLRNSYTRIAVLFHVFRHNEHEIEDIKGLTRRLGVELRLNKMRTDMGREIFETDNESIQRDQAWIPEDGRYSAFDLEKKRKKAQMICKNLWATAVINWDGSVLPCCAVYGERYAFGNVREQSFRSIWNNQNYRMARREIKDKVKNSHTICHICKEKGFLHF